MNSEKFVNKYLRMVLKLANKWHKIYWWIPFEDIKAEGEWALMEVYAKGKIDTTSTYVYKSIEGCMINLGEREFPFYHEEIENLEDNVNYWFLKAPRNPLQEAIWGEKLDKLQGKSRRVIRLITRMPQRFADFIEAEQGTLTNGISLGMIERYCVKYGIAKTHECYQIIFPEIREAIFS